MKANELKDVIRQIVNEEVRKEVQKQLPKLLFEMVGKSVTTQTTQRNEAIKPKTTVTEQAKTVVQPQNKPLKQYVKNPILNQILNETTPGLPNPFDTSVLDGIQPNFDKIGNSQEFSTEFRGMLNENVSQVEEIEPVNSVTPDISKLFNKNFKDILKKSVAKSKERSGGIS